VNEKPKAKNTHTQENIVRKLYTLSEWEKAESTENQQVLIRAWHLPLVPPATLWMENLKFYLTLMPATFSFWVGTYELFCKKR
jgi:hypothetical protein